MSTRGPSLARAPRETRARIRATLEALAARAAADDRVLDACAEDLGLDDDDVRAAERMLEEHVERPSRGAPPGPGVPAVRSAAPSWVRI